MNEKWEQQVRKMCALCCSTVFDSRHRAVEEEKCRNVLSHTHTHKRNDSFLCTKKSRDNSQKKALVSLFRHAASCTTPKSVRKDFSCASIAFNYTVLFFLVCRRNEKKNGRKKAASIRTEDRNMARSPVRYCLILLLWRMRAHTRNSTFAETILHRTVGMESA